MILIFKYLDKRIVIIIKYNAWYLYIDFSLFKKEVRI